MKKRGNKTKVGTRKIKKGTTPKELWKEVRKEEGEREKDKAIKDLGQARMGQSTITVSLAPQSDVQEEATVPAAVFPDPDPFGFNIDRIFKKIDEAIVSNAVSAKLAGSTAVPPKDAASRVRYYWQYLEEEEGMGPCFAITPKDFFDAEGCLADHHFEEESNDVPEGFINLMESNFQFQGTRQQAEAVLRANPLFEEKEMFRE